MAENIEKASKLRQIFPKETTPAKAKDTSISIGKKGQFGHHLTQNDPETLKFIGKHPVKDHGDIEDSGAFKVATSYSLDNEKNSRLKGHGKKKEREVYEAKEDGVCPKCHKAPCTCGNADKSQGEPAYKKDKKLLLGDGKKLREDTLANRIAMNILEVRKAIRIDEAQNLNPYAADKIGGGGMGGGGFAPKPKSTPSLKPRAFDDSAGMKGASTSTGALKDIPGSGASSLGKLQGTYSQRIGGMRDLYKNRDTSGNDGTDFEGGKGIGAIHKIDMGNPKFPRTVKGKVKEEVKLSNQQDTHDTEFTKGMEVHGKGEGEVQTHTKPAGPTSSDKSKKLVKKDTKGDPRSFREGAQPDPQLNQVEEGKDKVEKTMHEFKYGKLHSGSKTGPTVTKRKQAIAIALNQQRKAHEEVTEAKVGLPLNFRSKTAEGRPAKTKQSGDISNLNAGDLRQTHIQKRSEKPKLTAKGPFTNSSGWTEDAAEPLLGEGGKKKRKVNEGGAPADTPITVPNSTQNLKADTGFALEGGRSIGTRKRIEHLKTSNKANKFNQMDE